MFGTRNKTVTSRPPAESRTAIVVIVLISSLAFLLFQARKDALDNLLLHQARLAIQLAAAESGADTSNGVTLVDDGERGSSGLPAGIAAWPAQRTVAVPLASGCAGSPVCHEFVSAQDQDTKGRFVIRHGALFASLRGSKVAVMTSAPLSALAAGLFGRIAMDIAAVFFLACLLLLVRESRLSDYSVHRLLDASPIPLLLIDAQGQIEFANRQALDLFLDDPPRAPGRLQEALRQEGPLFSWLISEQDTGGAIETSEFETSRNAGSRRHLLVSRQSLAVRSKRMIIASVADITVRHEAESALVKAKNAAEALERMKSESLAMMSHELRTPVNGVLGLAQLLVQYELPDGAAQIVRRMIQAGKTLAVIINDIVDLALLEVRHIRLERRRFDLREVITGAATLASAAAAEKGLAVRVSALAPLPSAVFGDPARLQQIVINLVSNGIKFTEAGHIEVKTDVAARIDASIEIVIDVTDTGIGIAPEVIPRLFRPFSQAETGHEKRFEGTGLGLAISKGLAEAMGGSISVRSTVGLGSTFSVRLPFELAQREESAAKPAPASRVLIVDDVALNRDVVSELLRAEGCDVTTAGSGQDALDILKTQRFDLILMDIRMPVMDGLTTTAAIRSSREPNRHTGPILGLTANPLPTDRPIYLLRGIDGIIEKPVEVDTLRSALRQATLPTQTVAIEEPERIERLRQKLGQNRTLRIVAAFEQTAADALEGIATGCARAGLDAVAENAHRLAGAASNVGFEQLADAAADLEQIARTASATEVADAALTVVTIYRDVQRYVRVLLSSAAAEPENR
ncbi:response regulator [Paraburkholderia sp. UYCP14C]|uniref:hybrid sensor histidine kinase/response regulator n=1 Tax=Paraburkholderia sp. UYCP14C TaxID=2511130 RepID=UPI001021EC1A|nr:ATP-binding protein [Paraburkholderia sp. UYCP14C]RZF23740.1 response regulator [Paraburkholderia sp. UYCP14C]